MATENSYNPDIAIHPGNTLLDILDELGMKQVDLANRTGLTTKTINEIIKGKNPITPETSIRLSAVFGMSATFWNNLQRNYEETLTRLEIEKKLENELINLKEYNCYGELAHWGYVKKTRNRKEKVVNLLNFFGVSSLERIPTIHAIAFRKKLQGKLSKESLAAWLRCGELDAQKIETQKFDKYKLEDSIENLRKLTKEKPQIFEKELTKICASFGVAVVFVPYFKNTNVNGATRWLNPDKAIIQLSLRGRYDDIFWFTFFHELGHLFKHGKKDQFVEFDNKNNGREVKEKEADNFAREALIPYDKYSKFINQGDYSTAAIKNFANKLNISPSIVAGRLSFDHNDWTKWLRLRKKLQFVSPN